MSLNMLSDGSVFYSKGKDVSFQLLFGIEFLRKESLSRRFKFTYVKGETNTTHFHRLEKAWNSPLLWLLFFTFWLL